MEVRCRAPGKIILAGEHAVVHGAAAIAASIDLYTEVRISLHPSGQENELLELDLKDMGLNLSWPCSQLKEVLGDCSADGSVLVSCTSEKLELLSGLVAQKNMPQENVQLNSGLYAFLFLYTSILGYKPGKAVVTSELPMGSGLGSSASFCVALSGALIALSEGFSLKTKEKKDQFSFRKNDLELISKWAFEGEKIIHGKPSGIDNTVSTFGNMIKFKKELKTTNPMMPLNSTTPLKMLITDTRVGRNTKSLVSSVSERVLRHPDTMTSVFNAINSISDELALLVESPAEYKVEVSEKEEKLKELMQMNQGLLQCIGVSHESIETVVRTTMKEKLVSKLTGAGGGGCVLTFVPTLLSAAVTEKVISELEQCGFRCFMVEVGGPGVQVFPC
ncbi:Mevalonate kinase [Rhynchospora pubera]|uniref:Mevalonate kinase n=1 Tax=Rhynchospora pubera TaxID=906938 RepID=A0AAV8DVD2_9POAL|nr:Mevalonate kinase [Rhynchospora pubera]